MMRVKILILFFIIALQFREARSQEFQANVTVLSNRISTAVNKQIFQTLQSALYDFLNGRKWTNVAFANNEKIQCNFLVNLSAATDNNTYAASLTIQMGRPIYNTSYQSPLMNYMDENFVFKYIQYQTLDFNENRVGGTDPLTANLTAVIAYYAYIILGLNFDSYGLRGGDPYFQQAQNIVNNAPEASTLNGWKPFDGLMNRYWLVENLTNPKYNPIHDAMYNYYRQGLDQMFDHESDARIAVMNALSTLNSVNNEYTNIMFMQFFFQGKGAEIGNVFKHGTPDEKSRALDILSRIDISNLNQYKQSLQ
jgi:Domain of unknown function (DUF4835)